MTITASQLREIKDREYGDEAKLDKRGQEALKYFNKNLKTTEKHYEIIMSNRLSQR